MTLTTRSGQFKLTTQKTRWTRRSAATRLRFINSAHLGVLSVHCVKRLLKIVILTPVSSVAKKAFYNKPSLRNMSLMPRTAWRVRALFSIRAKRT